MKKTTRRGRHVARAPPSAHAVLRNLHVAQPRDTSSPNGGRGSASRKAMKRVQRGPSKRRRASAGSNAGDSRLQQDGTGKSAESVRRSSRRRRCASSAYTEAGTSHKEAEEVLRVIELSKSLQSVRSAAVGFSSSADAVPTGTHCARWEIFSRVHLPSLFELFVCVCMCVCVCACVCVCVCVYDHVQPHSLCHCGCCARRWIQANLRSPQPSTPQHASLSIQ